MKKAILYGRTSCPEERLESQFAQLRDIATQRGLELTQTYSDVGTLRSKSRRPGLNSLIRDARRGAYDVILLASFDRVVSSTSSLMALVSEIDALGIVMISVKDEVDTSTPNGRMFVTTIRNILQLQKSFTRESIKAGMRRRKLDGLSIGRAPLNIGHDAVVADRLSGMSLTEVAKRHSISRASVVRWVGEARLRGLG